MLHHFNYHALKYDIYCHSSKYPYFSVVMKTVHIAVRGLMNAYIIAFVEIIRNG